MKNYMCSVCGNEMYASGGVVGAVEKKVTYYKCEICGTELTETTNMETLQNSKIGKLIKKFTNIAIKESINYNDAMNEVHTDE
jgi:DNA-directed RNA polymerase subunit RPC12/RpoP